MGLLDSWFAQPEFLWTLPAIPVALTFLLYAYWRRRRGLAQLGSSLSLRKGLLFKPRVRRWKTLGVLTGLFLLGVACAGPQWGRDPTPQQRTGRDVILVLDMSRSMFAEQPSRRELAIRALRLLANDFEHHGGNRVALVLFAARPELLFPLTQDYDHLRYVLKQIEAGDYPPLSVDDPVSGTRFGAALTLALQTQESQRANRPVIVLLSDGDDPARDPNDPTQDDGEWLQGTAAAKAQHVRVYTVGFGDPDDSHPIAVGKERLEYDGKVVRTRLNEDRLKQIAERTGGQYLAAHRQTLPLGVYVQHWLDADALREEEPVETGLLVYQQRHVWFLLPAVLCLLLAMFLNEGPKSSWQWPWRFPMRWFASPERNAVGRNDNPSDRLATKSKLPMLLTVLTALSLISGEPNPPVEPLMRQGDAAFMRQDYPSAVKLYEEAESSTHDPGLVSFNKAAAYYRARQYREAIECYRRCLDDDQAPSDRRASAHFHLGNALFRQAGDGDADLFKQSASAYRACLREPGLSATLRADARHNLELAQMLWLQAMQKQKEKSPAQPEDEPKKLNQENARNAPTDSDDQNKEDGMLPAVDSTDGAKKDKRPTQGTQQKGQKTTGGTIQFLHDKEQVVAISIEDTLATLEKHAQRIADLRRKDRHPTRPGSASISKKDW